MSRAYYNEHDPFAAQWLRNLIEAGQIAPGDVDEQSIVDVRPADLAGYGQCHFFAGIGGWSYALRLAGWPDDRPVWTGSCPCQPFSAAGKGAGFADERHLWPSWFHLIRECRPGIVFGEQVASAIAAGRASPYMPEMRDREAVAAVLRELQGQPSAFVHGMREGRGARPEESQSSEDSGPIQGMEGREPRPRFGECGPASGEGAESPLHSRRSGHSGEDRRRALRNDGHRLRPDSAEGVELALFGPDRAGEGLHDRERSGGALCPERDGEHVGAEQDCRDCESDLGEAPGEIGRLVESLGGTVERTPEWAWIDTVRSDLEGAGYAFGMAVAPSCGLGAPHIRQRLGFVADGGGPRLERRDARSMGHECAPAERGSGAGGMANTNLDRQPKGRLPVRPGRPDEGEAIEQRLGETGRPGPTNGFWSNPDWLLCRDGKWRPTQSIVQPLADGIPDRLGFVRSGEGYFLSPLIKGATSRVGRLRGYGNAINPHQFAAFIGAYLDLTP